MIDVIEYARWMKLTYGGVMSVRSSQLKAIDAALLRYQQAKTPANLDSLRTAVMGWIKKEGPNWKASVRNKFDAVDDLYRQVMGVSGHKKTGAEMVALSHVRDESRAILTTLFYGKHLEWRRTFAEKLAGQKWAFRFVVSSATYSADKLSGGAIRHAPGQAIRATGLSGHGGALKLAEELVGEIGGVVADEVKRELVRIMPQFMTELAASLVPFVGVLTSAAGTVKSIGSLIRAEYRVEQARMHQERTLAIAEPAAAIAALIRLLERERTNEGLDVTLGIAECGGKLAGVLADGGTATNAAISLASAVLKFINIARIVTRDVLERRTANKLMQNVTLGTDLFQECPIVGAYMICCVPTSVMVNTIFDRFWQGGFRGEVERNVQRHVAPLQEQAQRLVTTHRFVIPELEHFPGVLKVNTDKLEAMLERKGKSGMVGFGGG